MQIYVAVVVHMNGVTGYVAGTEEALYEELQGFCERWWEELGTEVEPIDYYAEQGGAKAVVEAYFDTHQQDLLYISDQPATLDQGPSV